MRRGVQNKSYIDHLRLDAFLLDVRFLEFETAKWGSKEGEFRRPKGCKWGSTDHLC